MPWRSPHPTRTAADDGGEDRQRRGLDRGSARPRARPRPRQSRIGGLRSRTSSRIPSVSGTASASAKSRASNCQTNGWSAATNAAAVPTHATEQPPAEEPRERDRQRPEHEHLQQHHRVRVLAADGVQDPDEERIAGRLPGGRVRNPVRRVRPEPLAVREERGLRVVLGLVAHQRVVPRDEHVDHADDQPERDRERRAAGARGAVSRPPRTAPARALSLAPPSDRHGAQSKSVRSEAANTIAVRCRTPP